MHELSEIVGLSWVILKENDTWCNSNSSGGIDKNGEDELEGNGKRFYQKSISKRFDTESVTVLKKKMKNRKRGLTRSRKGLTRSRKKKKKQMKKK